MRENDINFAFTADHVPPLNDTLEESIIDVLVKLNEFEDTSIGGMEDDVQTQLEDLRQSGLEDSVLEANELYALVNKEWLDKWKLYVKNFHDESQGHPGEIDNSKMVTTEGKLKEEMQEHLDFAIIPLESWKLLKRWYGGGPDIIRNTIAAENGNVLCDLRPLRLKLAFHEAHTPRHSFQSFLVSKYITFEQLEQFAMKVLGKEESTCRLWYSFCSSPHRPVDDDDKRRRLYEILNPENEDQFLLEAEGMDGRYPLDYNHLPTPKAAKSKNLNHVVSSYRRSSYFENSGDNRKSSPGLCGLMNLGNTCFMNSALQCLTKAPQLLDYFTKDLYKSEINVHNPLGLKGELAETFASLMKLMWSGEHSCVTPSGFKTTISRIAPQFTGFHQHDSNELIGYLLNGLHDDLNRVISKPGTVVVEAGNKNEDEVAKIAWDVRTLRDDSVINDIFTGQYKGTVICPNCNYTSTTFNPFNCIQLPLPDEGKKIYDVTFISELNQKPPCKISVSLDSQAKIRDMRQQISELTGIPDSTVVIMDIFNQTVFNIYDDDSKCSGIRTSDVTVAYQIPKLSGDDLFNRETLSKLPIAEIVISIETEVNNYSYGKQHQKRTVGHPIILHFENGKTSGKTLYDSIDEYMRYFLLQLSDEDQQKILEMPKFPTMDEKDNSKALFQLSHKENSILPYSEEVLYFSDQKLNLTSRKSPFTLSLLLNVGDLSSKIDPSSFTTAVEHPSNAERSKKERLTLDRCFKLFAKQEQLSKENTWYCSKCKEHVQGIKKMDIYRAPEVLVLQLNRFQFDEYRRKKINSVVDFPLVLDISKHVLDKSNPNQIYDLYGVSNHFGSLGGGHYIAHCKVGSKWYTFDDSRVTPSNEDSIVDGSAYILFYSSRNRSKIVVKPQIDGHQRVKELGLQQYTT